jgi:putative transposase
VEPRLSGHACLPISHCHGGYRCARASPTAVWASNDDPVDQGSQFTSKELDLWAYANGVILDFSRPGKPTDNAYAESFNATVRLECLGRHWFLDLDDAREKIEEWRIEYNEVRPHSAINDRTPSSLIHQPRQTAGASPRPEILS